MALLKLVSNGKTTQVMLDGKGIEGLTDVLFKHHHEKDNDNNCKLLLGFDLTARNNIDSVNTHFFTDAEPGDFKRILDLYERMFENPETAGKEPPETQAMIDKMKSETESISE